MCGGGRGDGDGGGGECDGGGDGRGEGGGGIRMGGAGGGGGGGRGGGGNVGCGGGRAGIGGGIVGDGEGLCCTGGCGGCGEDCCSKGCLSTLLPSAASRGKTAAAAEDDGLSDIRHRATIMAAMADPIRHPHIAMALRLKTGAESPLRFPEDVLSRRFFFGRFPLRGSACAHFSNSSPNSAAGCTGALRVGCR